MPIFTTNARDFFLFAEEDAEQAAARVIDVVTNRIPQRFGLNPVEQVQVLSPMHRGSAGVGELNLALQNALNPAAAGKREWRHGGRNKGKTRSCFRKRGTSPFTVSTGLSVRRSDQSDGDEM